MLTIWSISSACRLSQLLAGFDVTVHSFLKSRIVLRGWENNYVCMGITGIYTFYSRKKKLYNSRKTLDVLSQRGLTLG